MNAPSGFGRTSPAQVAEESGIYVPDLPGLAPEKVALAAGVAQLARFIPKIGLRILGLGFDISDGGTGTNEVQKVQVKAKAGTYKLTFAGKQTAAIAFDALAAAVQSALVALPNIGAGDVEVTGGPGDENGTAPYVVTFKGALGHQDVPAMTADATGLTEGTKTVTITTQAAGESLRCDVGIYGADLNLIGANGGTEVADDAGAKALDFAEPVRVQPGHAYYAAFGTQGGAAKALCMVSADAAGADLVGKTAGLRELVTLAAGGYPLPDVIPVGEAAGTKAPLMALRTAAAS
jgi:hypothetical protein